MNTLTLRGFAGTIVVSLMVSQQAVAASAVWDVDVNPTNGFGGVTSIWNVSDAGTAFAEWNVFDSTSDSSPDVGSFGPAPQSVTETTGAAFLTGGGNIYSFAAATDFDVILSGYSEVENAVRTIALRIATLGTSVDVSSVLLDGAAPTIAGNTYTETITGGFGGAEEEWLFVWDGVSDRLTYQFDFNAVESSLSLDQLAVYSSEASVVPIPAAAWLFGSALLGLSGMSRRSRVTEKLRSMLSRLSVRDVDLMA